MAVGITTVTTIVGYSGLLMAQHPGLQSIGKAAVIGLATAFVTAVFVLPAILEVRQQRTGEMEEASR
jgi:predicted exporter